MKYFITLLFSFVLIPIYSQIDTIKQELDKMIDHAKTVSLYRNNIDWKSTEKKMYELAKEAKTIEDLTPALKHLLAQLGDEHGRVFYNNKPIAYYYGGQKPHQKHFNSDIYNKIQTGQYFPFKAELLNEEIGYIRIVGLPIGDNEQMAKEIQDEICRLLQVGAKKWIIDLRYNGGGNMHPMVEGIAAIIGEGEAGGTEGLTTDESSTWRVENGDFYYDTFSIQLPNDCSIDGYPKVAVLTSLYTASSGEVVAVALKGRPNTRFFGEKTLGMVTANNWHPISETTVMNISVSYYRDRAGIVYKKYVDVDEEAAFHPQKEVEDEGIIKAVKWLND